MIKLINKLCSSVTALQMSIKITPRLAWVHSTYQKSQRNMPSKHIDQAETEKDWFENFQNFIIIICLHYGIDLENFKN